MRFAFCLASVWALGCGADDPCPGGYLEGPAPACGGLPDWESEHGGEIRADNGIDPDGTSRTLVTAHFFDAQTGAMDSPNVHTDPSNALDCNWIGGSGGEGSTENPDPDEIYPFGDASKELGVTATFAPGGRHYLDVGETVTLQAEGNAAIELQRYEDHLTPFAGGSFHSIAYGPAPSSDATSAISADLMPQHPSGLGTHSWFPPRADGASRHDRRLEHVPPPA